MTESECLENLEARLMADDQRIQQAFEAIIPMVNGLGQGMLVMKAEVRRSFQTIEGQVTVAFQVVKQRMAAHYKQVAESFQAVTLVLLGGN